MNYFINYYYVNYYYLSILKDIKIELLLYHHLGLFHEFASSLIKLINLLYQLLFHILHFGISFQISHDAYQYIQQKLYVSITIARF